MKVFIGLPSYAAIMTSSMVTTLADAGASGIATDYRHYSSSVSTLNFNTLYCDALNLRPDVTHVCILHADIIPQAGWLQLMVSEMERVKADVLSAVVPMKDLTGDTSTGVTQADGAYVKKFTLDDVRKLPETFTCENIALNTGLMLIDIRGEWADKAYFEFQDKIIKKDGKFYPISTSEDWNYSRQALKLGAKLYATSKVRLAHVGMYQYAN